MWAITANSFKAVKAMNFKFDTRVPRDSPDMTPKFFPKRGVFKNLLGGDMHSHERLLVLIMHQSISRCSLTVDEPISDAVGR